MIIPWDAVGKVGIPILTALATALLQRLLQQRPKLISYVSHVSAFPLPIQQPPVQIPIVPAGGQNPVIPAVPIPAGPPAPQAVFAHSIVVRNVGKKTAMNVRIGHYAQPFSYQISPPVKRDVATDPNGSWEILIPALVPNEQIQVAYLYFPPTNWSMINSYTKSDEGLAQILDVLPTPYPRAWVKVIWLSVFYLGVAAAMYLLMTFSEWTYQLTEIIHHANGVSGS